MSATSSNTWTVLLVTARTPREAAGVEKQLLVYQRKGFISRDTVILTVSDPGSPNKGGGVGSGGATINALLYVVEHLCARQGYQVLSPDVLLGSKILMIHQGRSYPYGGFSRGFTLLPTTEFFSDNFVELSNNILHLYDFVTKKLYGEFEDGLWVCSSDMLIKCTGEVFISRPPSTKADACIFTVSSLAEYAAEHGVVVENEQRLVSDIMYTAPISKIQASPGLNGYVALVSGIVYLSVEVSEKLLALQSSPVLECCTYMGSDVGSRPHPVSLYFDILLAMCQDISEEDFLSRGSNISRLDSGDSGDVHIESLAQVRRLIWDNMRGFNLIAGHMEEVKHHYFDIRLRLRDHLSTIKMIETSPVIHTFVVDSAGGGRIAQEAFHSINCFLGVSITLPKKIIAMNSFLQPDLHMQNDVCIFNVDTRESYFTDRPKGPAGGEHGRDCSFTLKSGLCLQIVHMFFEDTTEKRRTVRVPIIYGVSDVLMDPLRLKDGCERQYCGRAMGAFMLRYGITVSDLWGHRHPHRSCTIWTARLFPVAVPTGTEYEDPTLAGLFWAFDDSPQVEDQYELIEKWRTCIRFSMEEIFQNVDVTAEYSQIRNLFNEILVLKMNATLLSGADFHYTPFFNSAVVDKGTDRLLAALDSVASTGSPGVAARALALTADMLGCMAEGRGGLRSGPAANKAFAPAFRAFEEGQLDDGVALMAKERQNWTNNPAMMIRCARHYEGAAQICIRRAVATARKFILLREDFGKPLDNTWYVAECAARIDLSGGWTDTPPIAYEKGGLVVNAALLINGKRPIGAKVKRTASLRIRLIPEDMEGTKLHHLDQLKDYNIPNAPGALLKACILFADIVDLRSEHSLETQLKSKWGCGFDISTWTNLPQGSGLGSSSILAAAIIAGLWSASGKDFDNSTVIHAVLCIEQMLTTGGGWQDQVGGVYGGFKAGSSAANLPLEVSVQKLDVDYPTVVDFDSRILLIYTGKPRLAKNLLQNVVRNWYARESHVVATCSQLVENAKACRDALVEWNFDALCECITRYYEQKKLMAPGTEPASVKKIIDALQPYICAHTLAGAGGGGFLFCVLKNPFFRHVIPKILDGIKGAEGAVVFRASIDTDGMKLFTQSDAADV